MESLSTLCYIENDGKYLMLHRNVKENDVNEGKWIGVGGHFEADESPEECLLREVKEEDRVYTDILSVPGHRDLCIRKRCDGIYVVVYGRWI